MKKHNFKKLVFIFSAIIVFVLLIFIFHSLNKKDKDCSADNSEIFTEKTLNDSRVLALEYSNTQVNPLDYLKKHNDEVSVKPKTIDLNVVGNTEVTYTINGKKLVCEFEVNDTQSPVITFQSDSVDATAQSDENVEANILSVTDPVDGNLPKLDQAPERFANTSDGRVYDTGWYTVSVTDNSVTVHASDKHGNETEKSYSIKIVNPSFENSSIGLFCYQALGLSGINEEENWQKINDSDWYYSACTYMSSKYQNVEEAMNDVKNYGASIGNDIPDESIRIFCAKDESGIVQYYQAGIEL